MNWKKAYSALLALLEGLGPNVGRRELLVGLQAWLQRHLAVFGPELQRDYGLRSYASLELARYPIENSSLNAAEHASCGSLHPDPPTRWPCESETSSGPGSASSPASSARGARTVTCAF